MQPRSMYFLYGYFGVGNFGDDILLYSAIENILERDHEAKFLIRNHGPLDFLAKFHDRFVCTDIEQIHHSKNITAIKFFHLLKAYWRYTGQSSHLVIGGGTLIHDAPYLKSTFLLLCLCLIARLRRRRVIGIGLGVKEMRTKSGTLLVKLLLPCFHTLCLRDKRTFDQCLLLRPSGKNMVLTSDLAYALEHDRYKNDPNKIIALTLVDYVFDQPETINQKKILLALADTLTNLVRQGFQVRLLALQKQNTALKISGDERILEQLCALIPKPYCNQCQVILLEPTPQSITGAYTGVSLMIGMRFHSLIFSALFRIPFIGLGHEPKIGSICEEFLMPCLTIDALDQEGLERYISTALPKAIDTDQINLYQTRSENNFSFLDV